FNSLLHIPHTHIILHPTSPLTFPFPSSRPPRYLHSFPTRRSSDLAADRQSRCYHEVDRSRVAARKSRRHGCRHTQGSAPTTFARDRKSTRLNSSSRGHLVCRLLLEKKKTKKIKGRYVLLS